MLLQEGNRKEGVNSKVELGVTPVRLGKTAKPNVLLQAVLPADGTTVFAWLRGTAQHPRFRVPLNHLRSAEPPDYAT